MVTNDWVTRKFYVGDRTAQPFMEQVTLEEMAERYRKAGI